MALYEIPASQLQIGDEVVEPENVGVVTGLWVEDDAVIFYVAQETGGFMTSPTTSLRVRRQEMAKQ